MGMTAISKRAKQLKKARILSVIVYTDNKIRKMQWDQHFIYFYSHTFWLSLNYWRTKLSGCDLRSIATWTLGRTSLDMSSLDIRLKPPQSPM